MSNEKSNTNTGAGWTVVLGALIVAIATIVGAIVAGSSFIYMIILILPLLAEKLVQRFPNNPMLSSILFFIFLTSLQFLWLLGSFYVFYLADPEERIKSPDKRSFLRYYAGISKSYLFNMLFIVVFMVLFNAGFKVPDKYLMQPEMLSGDIVMFTNVSYLFSDPERGDVVYVLFPDRRYWAGRIVGLPSEIYKLNNGIVEINCMPLKETYVNNAECSSCGGLVRDTLKADEYFVVSDDRSLGNLGSVVVNRKDIWGKYMLRVSPSNSLGLPNDYSADFNSIKLGDANQSALNCNKSSLVYGPVSGKLIKESDNSIPNYYVSANLQDFIAETTFQNPASKAAPWSYGFIFRSQNDGGAFRLIINSDGSWFLTDSQPEKAFTVQEGSTKYLNTEINGANIVRLIANGGKGAFYVNGEKISDLNLTGHVIQGGIMVASAFSSDSVIGQEVSFSNFNVWKLGLATDGPFNGYLTHYENESYGPFSGKLIKEFDNVLPSYGAPPILEDFIAEVTFQNPKSNSTTWNYGFVFRFDQNGGEGDLRLAINSDRSWYLENYKSDGSSVIVQKGVIPYLKTDLGDLNDVRLLGKGKNGAFYVNGIKVSDLDLSNHVVQGVIFVVSGFSNNEEIGQEIPFLNFSVWNLELDTASSFNGYDENIVPIYESGVEKRDFIAEVTFINPYSTDIRSWDYGFLFRKKEENDQFRLVVVSDGSWILLDRKEGEDVEVAKGIIPNLNIGAGGENKLRLVCKGNVGEFYVNDKLISSIDLSSRMISGKILIASGIYKGNFILGKSTFFKDFSVTDIP